MLTAATRVRTEERRDVFGAFVTLLGFMGGHALLETARDALFLSSLPASHLPWAYLSIAIVALPLTLNRPAFLKRLSSRHELSAWLVFAGVVTAAFWLALRWPRPLLFYALYTWSGVLATIVVVRFWTALGTLFTVTQAKRLFAVIGTGSVLGAILGSAAARLLAEWLPARHLVLAAAVAFVSASLGPRFLPVADPGTTGEHQRRPMLELMPVLRRIWSRPYLRHVALLILVSTVTLTTVDFLFKLTVDRYIAPGQFDEFFASVYLTLNVLSLVVQVVAVGWVVRRVGVVPAVAVMPALILVAGAGFAVASGVGLALVLKGVDGTLRHSLNRTGTELLFVPLAVEARARIKAVIDVVGQRGGQAVASLLILLIVAVTTNLVVFAVLATLSAMLWLATAWRLRGPYLDVFRETLSQEITARTIRFPALDLASLETLLSTLNDPDDRRVIAALDLLAAQAKLNVVPALILYHPSPDVVIHALTLFTDSDRTDVVQVVERLHTHREAGVRAAALVCESVLRPARAPLDRSRNDRAAEVRAVAVAGLVGGGWLDRDEGAAAIRSIVRSEHRDARLALARAVQHLHGGEFEDALIGLAGDPDADVRVEAVRAMRHAGSLRSVPTLIGLLSYRALRDEVRLTLLALGPAVLPRLVEALRNPELAHGIRRQIPSAIAAFGSQQAANLLAECLPDETDGMIRFKVLDALGVQQEANPHVRLPSAVLTRASSQTLAAATGFLRWRQELESSARQSPAVRTALHELLVALLEDKQRHALERLFRLLDLQEPDQGFLQVYRGLHSARRESRAGGRELLEHMVPSGVRAPLLVLIDDSLEPRGGEGDHYPSVNRSAVLAEIVRSSTESLSAVAAHHAAELDYAELAGELARCTPLSPAHATVLGHARERLVGGSAV